MTSTLPGIYATDTFNSQRMKEAFPDSYGTNTYQSGKTKGALPNIYASGTFDSQKLKAARTKSYAADTYDSQKLKTSLRRTLSDSGTTKYSTITLPAALDLGEETETESDSDNDFIPSRLSSSQELWREAHLPVVSWQEFLPGPSRLRLGRFHPPAEGARYLDVTYQGRAFLWGLPPLLSVGEVKYYDEYRPEDDEHPYTVGKMLLKGPPAASSTATVQGPPKAPGEKEPYDQCFWRLRRYGLAICQLLRDRYPQKRVVLFSETTAAQGLAALFLYRYCTESCCRPDLEELCLTNSDGQKWIPVTFAALLRELATPDRRLEVTARIYITIYERVPGTMVVDPYLLIRHIKGTYG